MFYTFNVNVDIIKRFYFKNHCVKKP